MKKEKTSEKEENKQSFIGWLTSPQMIVSLSAMILGICGLFVSIYETSLMREQQQIMKKQQYASVWPNIEIGPSALDSIYQIKIQNTGIGPAQIKAAGIKYNGEIVSNWYELSETLTGVEGYRAGRINLINGAVIPPNTESDFIYSINSNLSDNAFQLTKEMRREIDNQNLDIIICYCSVYSECWEASVSNSLKRLRGESVLDKEELKVKNCEVFPNSGI